MSLRGRLSLLSVGVLLALLVVSGIASYVALGTYQRIFLIELDHPRMRRVMVNVIGC